VDRLQQVLVVRFSHRPFSSGLNLISIKGKMLTIVYKSMHGLYAGPYERSMMSDYMTMVLCIQVVLNTHVQPLIASFFQYILDRLPSDDLLHLFQHLLTAQPSAYVRFLS
jgi:hypothetical protein